MWVRRPEYQHNRAIRPVCEKNYMLNLGDKHLPQKKPAHTTPQTADSSTWVPSEAPQAKSGCLFLLLVVVEGEGGYYIKWLLKKKKSQIQQTTDTNTI